MTEEDEKAIACIEKRLSRKANYDTGVWIPQLELETVLNLIKKQQEEIEKKDKQIDLMASYINKLLNDVMFRMGFEIELEKYNDNKIEEECIKEYFKKKAEDK